MNELTLENWLGLATVFSGVLIALWLGKRVQDSAKPKHKPQPPAE